MKKELLLIAVFVLLLLPIIHAIRIQITKSSNELIIYKEGKSLQMDIRVGTEILTTCLLSKTMNNYRLANNTLIIQEINTIAYADSILLNKHIQLFNFNSTDCQEIIFNKLPIKDPLMLRHLLLSDSILNSKNTLITFNLKNSSHNTGNASSCLSNYFLHEINIDGPFILKF